MRFNHYRPWLLFGNNVVALVCFDLGYKNAAAGFFLFAIYWAVRWAMHDEAGDKP